MLAPNDRKNAEGYSDPTAYQALKNIEAEEERFRKLLYAIFDICELADFAIEGRIVLIDKRYGRGSGSYSKDRGCLGCLCSNDNGRSTGTPGYVSQIG